MPTKGKLTRRGFLASSLGGLAWAVSDRPAHGKAFAANERIAVGVIGVGRRGACLAHHVVQEGGGLAALCDVWSKRLDRPDPVCDRRVRGVRFADDYRRVLDDGTIDAVVIATPDHWHHTMLLDAVSAGKHVYLETPVARTIEQVGEAVSAVRDSRCVVQVGHQHRSCAAWRCARGAIAAEAIGSIEWVRMGVAGRARKPARFKNGDWLRANRPQPQRKRIVARCLSPFLNHAQKPTRSAGAGPPSRLGGRVNWPGFIGRAPERPFDPQRLLSWRGFSDYSCGALADLGQRYVDAVGWVTGATICRSVVAAAQPHPCPWWQTPGHVHAVFDLGVFAAILDVDADDAYRRMSITFHGSDGRLTCDGGVWLDRGAGREHLAPGPRQEAGSAHVRYWLDSIRMRRRPNAPVDVAARAAVAVHLAEVAQATSQRIGWDPLRRTPRAIDVC